MFAPIEGFSNYRVCNEGYIVYFPSMIRKKSLHINNNSRKINKYERVSLRSDDDNKIKILLLHRLVCKIFQPNPHCYNIVDHIDGNEKNNHYLNLRWVSARQNTFNRVSSDHKYITGVEKKGNRYVVHFGRNKYCKYTSFETYLEAAKYRLQLEKETGDFFRAQIPEKVTLEILNDIIDGF